MKPNAEGGRASISLVPELFQKAEPRLPTLLPFGFYLGREHFYGIRPLRFGSSSVTAASVVTDNTVVAFVPFFAIRSMRDFIFQGKLSLSVIWVAHIFETLPLEF